MCHKILILQVIQCMQPWWNSVDVNCEIVGEWKPSRYSLVYHLSGQRCLVQVSLNASSGHSMTQNCWNSSPTAVAVAWQQQLQLLLAAAAMIALGYWRVTAVQCTSVRTVAAAAAVFWHSYLPFLTQVLLLVCHWWPCSNKKTEQLISAKSATK